MNDDDKQALNEMAGVFVEAALTDAQIAQAIMLEKQLGIHAGQCAFLAEHGELSGDAGAGSKTS